MSYSEPVEVSLDIGWPIPKEIKTLNERNRSSIAAVVKWKEIVSPFQEYSFDLSSDEGFVTNGVVFRVLIGTSSTKCNIDSCKSAEDIVNDGDGKTYLAPKPEFKIGLAPGCELSCFRLQAIYEIGTVDGKIMTTKSEYCDPICVLHPPDIYCQRTNNNFTNTKTQNNISSRRRYAQAVKNIRAAQSYSGTYIGGWGGKKFDPNYQPN